MTWTLSLQIAPDNNTGGDTTTAGVSIIVNGTEHALGNATSLSASLAGTYRWSTHTFDVSSWFSPSASTVVVRVQFVSGWDTVHIRRVHITDGSDVHYDEYGLRWWDTPAPYGFINIGYGCDPNAMLPRCRSIPATASDLAGLAIVPTPGGAKGAFLHVIPEVSPCYRPRAHLGLVAVSR